MSCRSIVDESQGELYQKLRNLLPLILDKSPSGIRKKSTWGNQSSLFRDNSSSTKTSKRVYERHAGIETATTYVHTNREPIFTCYVMFVMFYVRGVLFCFVYVACGLSPLPPLRSACLCLFAETWQRACFIFCNKFRRDRQHVLIRYAELLGEKRCKALQILSLQTYYRLLKLVKLLLFAVAPWSGRYKDGTCFYANIRIYLKVP